MKHNYDFSFYLFGRVGACKSSSKDLFLAILEINKTKINLFSYGNYVLINSKFNTHCRFFSITNSIINTTLS